MQDRLFMCYALKSVLFYEFYYIAPSHINYNQTGIVLLKIKMKNQVSIFLILLSLSGLTELLGLSIKETQNEDNISKNLSRAITDIAVGINNCKSLIIFQDFGKYNRNKNIRHLIKSLQSKHISTILYQSNDKNKKRQELYFNYIINAMEESSATTSLFFCSPVQCEEILYKIREKNLIHRHQLYIFYWGERKPTSRFMVAIHEAMRVAVITNPKTRVYHLFYNQVLIDKGEGLMSLVNWWEHGRLYRSPALPPSLEVYSDLGGRVFRVPVLHAPPWYFVKQLDNSSLEVTGGRDHQLLTLLAAKLNFKIQYFDPPHHSQGSGISANGSFRGVLGMIYRREADLFLGDVTMSWERQRGVEFSFLTLADGGAFVTHARRHLSEALALLRPFRWQVWPIILLTVVGSGPALWVAAAGRSLWDPHNTPKPSLSKCAWFTMSIFLKQSRPTLESPLASLSALENAMRTGKYQLLVESHSSSLAKLENGTGVYGRLWKLMQLQETITVHSVEQGVRRVLYHNRAPTAFLAGRETLYFNTRRFGASNFQLSEKLYTRYSAIALQVGCPYIQNINKVLLQLFEAGILTKMTFEEYEKLGIENKPTNEDNNPILGEESSSKSNSGNGINSSTQLGAISMRMLQGAFYILLFGYVLSGVTLVYELKMHKPIKEKYNISINRIFNQLRAWNWIYSERNMKDIKTQFDYIE